MKNGKQGFILDERIEGLNDFNLLRNDSLLITSGREELKVWNSLNGNKILRINVGSLW